MSRMADQRRDSSASKEMITMTPTEVTHQRTVISQRIPSGGEAMVVAMVCSVFELARLSSQQQSTTMTAAPRRRASPPRRRVWPSPTGA